MSQRRLSLHLWPEGNILVSMEHLPRISDSLKTVFHNIGGDFENDEAEEGEEEAV